MVRLLLVDDEPGFRTLSRMVLEDHDHFDVAGEAEDGQQAIGEARRLKPDAVLLDLNMPVMGGLEAIPRLRTAAPGSRIIVLSVARRQEELDRARMAGAHAFIDKALSNSEFVAALESCFATPDWSEHRRETFGLIPEPAAAESP